MEPVEISVIIVLQDRAETVPTVLAHLEQQTLPAAQFEIVAIDSGSTGQTRGVLERYTAGAPVRMQIHSLGRQTVPKSRNIGIERARGRWLVFLDQDVLASPHLLERYAREFRAAAHPWLLGAVARHPQLPANVLTRHLLQEEIPVPLDPNQLTPVEWHGYNFGVARALVRDAGGFDESFPSHHFLEAALAHRFAGMGVWGQYLPKAYCYEWRTATLDEERARWYARGHSLHHLEQCIGNAAASVVPELPGPLRRRLDQLMLPYYLRACRNAQEDIRYATGMYRRVLHHDLRMGYLDARRGRTRRA